MNKHEALKVLGLESGAEDAEIKGAYRRLALLYHPDRNSKGTEETRLKNQEKFKKINEANEILMDKTSNVMDENIAEDFFSTFFKFPTKKEYMEDFAELFEEVGLDVSNLQIFNAMTEEEIDIVAHSLGELYENNCLTQESFNVACEHLTWPGKTEYDLTNPYVSKFIFETLVSKMDLTASLTCDLKDYNGLVKAFNRLSGHEDSGDGGWSPPYPNLVTQERLNHVLNNPKAAQNIGLTITRLNKVNLLTPENEKFVWTYLEEMGTHVFSPFTDSIKGKSEEKTRDLLEQAHTRLNWNHEREGSVDPRIEANLTKTLENKKVFELELRNSKSQSFPSQEFEAFKQKYSRWLNKEALFSVVKIYLENGLVTGEQLGSFHGFMFDFIRSPQSNNMPIALMQGLVTIDDLNKICEWSVEQGTHNDDYLRYLLSDDCVLLMQQGLFSQEDVYAFASSPHELAGYIKEQVINFHSNAATQQTQAPKAQEPENNKALNEAAIKIQTLMRKYLSKKYVQKQSESVVDKQTIDKTTETSPDSRVDVNNSQEKENPSVIDNVKTQEATQNDAARKISRFFKEKVKPSISKKKYNDFCNDIKQMMEGIGEEDRLVYNKFTTSGNDYLLRLSESNTSLASATYKAFQPFATNVRSRYAQTIVEFNITNAEANHALLTHEGREAAYDKLAAHMGSIILNESGRYGGHIQSLTQTNDLSKNDIKQAVQSKVDEYQSQFNHADNYAAKNEVLLKMAELYATTRDKFALKELITHDKSTLLDNTTFGPNEEENESQDIDESSVQEEFSSIHNSIKTMPKSFSAMGGNVHLDTQKKTGSTVIQEGTHVENISKHENSHAPVENNIDWNLCFKILSGIAAVAGGAMLVVGLLLPIPGLAIAGACLLVVGVAGYAASKPNSEGEEEEQSFGFQ